MSDSNNPPKEAKEAAAGSSGPRFVSGASPQVPRLPYAQQSPVYNPDDSGTDGTNGTNANNATDANNATNPTVAPNGTTPSDMTDWDGIGPLDDPGCGIDPARMPADTRRFDKIIPVLIAPDSAVSDRFPLLHRVIAGRLKTSLDLRGGRRVSRCSHAYSLGPRVLNQNQKEKYRPDSHAFQTKVVSSSRRTSSGRDNARLEGMCKKLRRRVRISGCIGSGGMSTCSLFWC